ncbi:MAG: ferritin family protein [Candidatus Omnitrophota bacterium]|jgi:rubrerythrin
MGNIFAGSEIVEIGIQIENNGRDFYNTLVKQSENPKAREVFGFLAGEEEKHIKVFQGILDKTQKFEPQSLDADDYLGYMKTLAGEHIFTQKNQGDKIAQSIKNDKEAIEVAIRFEEDSIVFYAGMKKIVPEYDHKVIDFLIMQEENHLKQLLDMRKLL